ncbi:MAG: ASCH/PUA domain-containing protein [Clostridium sp.]
MGKIHELKILPKYFNDIWSGRKNFELRKNDRGFNIGDTLILKGFEDGDYTGDALEVVVTYILFGGEYGLDNDYVILGIE